MKLEIQVLPLVPRVSVATALEFWNWKAIREAQGISESWPLHSERHYDWIS